MAVSLSDIAKVSTDPLEKGIIMQLLRFNPIMDLIPWENVGSLNIQGLKWSTLPTVGWRKLNGAYTESTGTVVPVSEAIYGFGGDIDIDKVFTQITNVVEDPEVTQTRMKLKSMAAEWNYYFIHGAPDVNADGFYGLQYRVDQLYADGITRQKTAIGTAGTPYDGNASAAARHKVIDKLYELDDLVGGASAYFCNRAMRLGISSILRQASLMDTSRDQFDRQTFSFAGAPIVDVGYRYDQSTEIITDTEDPGDGVGDTTSIYAVRFESGDGVIGIQLNNLEVHVVAEELEAKPAKRVRVDWWNGIMSLGDYSIARGYNFKPAGSWT